MLIELLLQLLESQPKELKSLLSLPFNTYGQNVKEEIDKLYEEYKIFMGIEYLPEYILSYKKRERVLNKDSYSLAEIEYDNGRYHIWVTDSAFNREDRKEILFHEFTHIFDKEYLFNKWKFSKDSKLGNVYTHIYTEIHAEQVKFLLLIGMNNQSKTELSVESSTIITDLNGYKTEFNEYLLKFKENLIIRTNEIKSIQLSQGKISEQTLLSFINMVAYYIGALSVYISCCKHDANNLMDLSILSEFWEKDMDVSDKQSVRNIIDLINMYCTRDIYSLKKNEIADSGTLLMYNWKKNAEDNLHIL